ncbi:hypothetical protein MMC25_000773 [Agyrium rufum]|nr:hypothetical protein [Agyrium rufum]
MASSVPDQQQHSSQQQHQQSIPAQAPTQTLQTSQAPQVSGRQSSAQPTQAPVQTSPSNGTPQLQQATSAAGSSAQSNATPEPLQCQWVGCGERAASAEQLYEHVCERHVGRRSTNNLNLTCAWGSCRTSTVKRDHITSHIRVHVPLKPHKCDFCGKSFKRPQDLKKHVKTHADDSVIMQPDSAGLRGGHHPGGHSQGGFNPSAQRAYFPDPQMQASMHMPYQYHQNASGYYAPTQQSQQQQPNSNGYIYYNVNSNGSNALGGQHTSYDTRKRAADTMNDFFGDAKRRAFDPNSYNEVGNRLMAFSGLQLPIPMSGGGGGGLDAYTAQPAPQIVRSSSSSGDIYGPSAPSFDIVPSMPNLRSKRDLQLVTSVLENALRTAYDAQPQLAHANAINSSSHYAASMNSATRNNSHANAAMEAMRSSHSPPTHLGSNHYMPTASVHSSTPALTPSGSTDISHSVGHSPSSNDGGRNSFDSSNGDMGSGRQGIVYPSLPSATVGLSNGMPMQAGMAPSPGLGVQYDRDDSRHRMRGGRLGKAVPAPLRSYDQYANDSKNSVAGPSSSSKSGGVPTPATTRDIKFSELNIDPALDPALMEPMPSAPSTLAQEKQDQARDETGAENMEGVIEGASVKSDGANTPRRQSIANTNNAMGRNVEGEDYALLYHQTRLLESLKRYVDGRLERGEWESSSDGSSSMSDDHIDGSPRFGQSNGKRAVRGGDAQREDEEERERRESGRRDSDAQGMQGLYPVLREVGVA